MTTGGNVSNCGIDLALLGFRVGVITRVGDDAFGEFLRREYRRHRLQTGGIIVDTKAQTSSTMVSVDRTGERTFFHARGAMRNFRPSDILGNLGIVARAKILAVGYLGLLPESEPGLALLFSTVRRRTGVRILLDTGGTPKRNDALLASLLPEVDYFLPSFEEAAELTGARSPEGIIRRFRALGARGVVGVKLGARGCHISWEGKGKHIPAVKVRTVVDATGAGDAFVAGFLAGVLKGLDPFQAARVAVAVAGSCVTAVGASTAIQPLRAYLRGRRDPR